MHGGTKTMFALQRAEYDHARCRRSDARTPRTRPNSVLGRGVMSLVLALSESGMRGATENRFAPVDENPKSPIIVIHGPPILNVRDERQIGHAFRPNFGVQNCENFLPSLAPRHN